MRKLMLLVVGTLMASWLPATHAAETLRDISWAELRKSGQLSAGEVLPAKSPKDVQMLKIENVTNTPKTVKLFELKSPGVTHSAYAIRGRARYEKMKGRSYLEMWNHFPDGARFFSRTLATRGVLKYLEGTSDWRDFSLPFSISGRTDRPDRLVVNLVFKGSGTVYLAPMQLKQYAHAQEATMLPGAWWGDRTAGLIGGILGSALGCLGGLIGVLASRGRARAFVMALTAAIVLFGIALLGAGVVALLLKQPYAVHYPLLLIGGLGTLIVGPMRRVLRRRYEQKELQQISAMDLGSASP
ncbi:MAG: hypothetical protein JW888_07775 [Pirellulales bacterium]|nr:hypothetical protein [Pirellulales bacterium]